MFYVAVNNEQKGPFSIAELAKQNLNPSTLVWKEGMAEWLAIKDVPELASLMPASPPPPPPPAPTPPPIQATAPAPPPRPAAPRPPAVSNAGGTLETGGAEMPNILDNELGNAAKETFSNMKLSTEGIMDFKSTNFNANRGTVYALAAFAPFLIGSLFTPTFGIGALLMLLLFVVLPIAAGGLTWLEMRKLIAANGGPVAAGHFKWAGLILLGAAGIFLILSLIIGFANPFTIFAQFGTIKTLMTIAGLGLLAVAVFHVMAGMKVMNYKAKHFKEFAYSLFIGMPVALLFFYIAFNSGGGLFRILGGIAYILPLLMAIVIFQRAGKNNNQVA